MVVYVKLWYLDVICYCYVLCNGCMLNYVLCNGSMINCDFCWYGICFRIKIVICCICFEMLLYYMLYILIGICFLKLIGAYYYCYLFKGITYYRFGIIFTFVEVIIVIEFIIWNSQFYILTVKIVTYFKFVTVIIVIKINFITFLNIINFQYQ